MNDVLLTARLRLEPQCAAHADEMHAVLGDPAIYAYENDPPPSVAWLRERYARLESRRSPDGLELWLNWVLRLHDGPANASVQASVHAGDRAEVAYVLASALSGQGLATEGVHAMGKFEHLSIATPRLAPYGLAATETLKVLGLAEALQSRIVTGESITQAQQFVVSGSAELGFIAFSQIHKVGKLIAGSHWLVPAKYHSPIRQDAVVLARGKGNAAVEALAGFLKSRTAADIIKCYGYDL